MNHDIVKTEYRRFLADRTLPLDAMLDALSKFGKPRVCHDGKGWFCAVDMYVTEKGLSSKSRLTLACRPLPMPSGNAPSAWTSH